MSIEGKPDPVFRGCDVPEAGAARLIPFDAALRRGQALAVPVPETESLPLAQAMGRVLARPAVAQTPLPPFDNSAMDGYAVRTADLHGSGPWTLPVAARIAAGDTATGASPPGTAARMLTGALVPRDFDAVIMQEHTERRGDTITLTRKPDIGENIRRTGEDLERGGTILEAGRCLAARELGALAAIGMGKATVHRKIRVAVFSTGTELREPGDTLAPGQIWNSNRFMLMGDLTEPWIELVDFGTVRDDAATLKATLAEATARADIVVSTGGVSVGDKDHMPGVFREIGGRIEAMRVAMKPGKPVMVGTKGQTIYIGLPGNPVSAYVTWSLIGRKILERRAGIENGKDLKLIVKAGFHLSRRPGRCEFRPATITQYDATGARVVEVADPSFSAKIASLAKADGLALLPASNAEIRKGDPLEFLPF